MNRRIQDLKKNIADYLQLSAKDIDDLDDRLGQIRMDMPGSGFGLIGRTVLWFILAYWVIQCMSSFNLGCVFWVSVFAIWIWFDHNTRVNYPSNLEAAKRSYANKQAEALAMYLGEKLTLQYREILMKEFQAIPLKSLREVGLDAFYRVYLADFEVDYNNRPYFPVDREANERVRQLDLNDWSYYSEVFPGVWYTVYSLPIDLKCDFRVVRDSMSQRELEWIFKKVLSVLPFISLDSISIKQWSSTKEFLLDKSFLEDGTITRFIQKRKGIAKRNSSAKQSGLSRSSSATTPSYADMAAKRLQSEKIAMDVVQRFEQLSERIPHDVSSQNIGYDILSTSNFGADRKIEVKGISATGNVILTENELRTALSSPDDYFIYVVDNCAQANGQILYVKNGVDRSELREDIVGYEFMIEQQNLHADMALEVARVV